MGYKFHSKRKKRERGDPILSSRPSMVLNPRNPELCERLSIEAVFQLRSAHVSLPNESISVSPS